MPEAGSENAEHMEMEEAMPWINKIMRKLPKKQITPEELEQQARKFEQPPLVVQIEEKKGEDGLDENGEYEILEREILPEKIICPDCGGITLEGLDFCDKCGGTLH